MENPSSLLLYLHKRREKGKGGKTTQISSPMPHITDSGRKDGRTSRNRLTQPRALTMDRETPVLQHHDQIAFVQLTAQPGALPHSPHSPPVPKLPRIVPPSKRDVVEGFTSHAVLVHSDVRQVLGVWGRIDGIAYVVWGRVIF